LVFSLDRNGVFQTFIQPNSAPEYYLPAENFIGHSYHKILPVELIYQLNKALRALKETGQVQQFEYSLSIGGQRHWFNAKLSQRTEPSAARSTTCVASRRT
jgi:hypothetical protein